MGREVMRRRAADNEYLHRDFHGALSTGLDFVEERLGEEAVREYLRELTLRLYGLVREELRRRGLAALEEHFRRIYAVESGEVELRLGEDELELEVAECPAVRHMRAQGYPVARLWYETDRTVNAALCEGTEYEAQWLEYDALTGRSRQRFVRRAR